MILAMQLVDLINGLTTGAVGSILILTVMLIQQQRGLWRARRALKKADEETKTEGQNNGV